MKESDTEVRKSGFNGGLGRRKDDERLMVV